jgi:hypothetical protein
MVQGNEFLNERFVIFNQRGQTSKNLRLACHELLKPKRQSQLARQTIVSLAADISRQHQLDHRPIFVTDEEIAGVIPGRGRNWAIYPHLETIMDALCEGFAPREVRFFAYFRNKDSWLRSAYQEVVKRHHMALGLDEYLERVEFSSDFPALLREAGAGLAEGQFVHVDMAADAGGAFGLGDSLLRWLGLSSEDMARIVKPERVNESISADMLKLFLQLNRAELDGKDLMTVKRIILRHHGYKW